MKILVLLLFVVFERHIRGVAVIRGGRSRCASGLRVARYAVEVSGLRGASGMGAVPPAMSSGVMVLALFETLYIITCTVDLYRTA